MAKNIISEQILEPLNGVSSALIDIHAGDGNLTMDGMSFGDPVLVSGSLEYTEDQGSPIRHLEVKDGEVSFSVQGGRDVRPRFRMPWATCNAATNWSIHLNQDIPSGITARSNGGNLKLDFGTVRVMHLLAETGGGNIEIVLPDKTVDLKVNAKTGAGNVSISIPHDVAASIHASTGLGKVIMDPSFNQVDKITFQTPDFERAGKKMELMLASGVGNINVSVM